MGRLALVLAMLMAACAGGSNTVQLGSDGGDAALLDGAGNDLQAEGLATADVEDGYQGDPKPLPDASPADVPADFGAWDSRGQCAPGDGCFLDPCDGNADCQSGWCVEHMGDKVCTVDCQEECPAGWSCQQVAGAAPDVVFICVSDHANLCRPCRDGNDCQGSVGGGDVCVDYGPEGAFCGGSCTSGKACPWGFTCKQALTVDGIEVKQCIADLGTCPCTETSVELALWTACSVVTEWGTCEGMRVCTEDGLAPCDAPTPSQDVCNGLDDDCDGEVDEDTCDDANPCTKDSCLGPDGCLNAAQEGECIDGNPCTVADHCVAGVCTGSPVKCDDSNPCTDDGCDEAGGCVFEANDAGCDDGNPCTVADVCSQGVCAGTQVSCECQSDADCAPLDDGDACNGKLFCDKGKFPFACAIVPGSPVECPESQAFCQQAFCDPKSGACSFVPAHDGMPCDDGDACLVGETCGQGKCSSGSQANCEDGNPCTDDSCDSTAGCVHAANTAPCFDGDFCTSGDQCSAGACVGKQVVSCEDGNPCTLDTCTPASGCAHEPSAGSCDDGNLCTEGDSCSAGKCLPGKAADCNDLNPCTDDSCSPTLGCVHSTNTLACSDGNACTVGDKCSLGQCVSGQMLACADGNPCTDDSCDPVTGCKFAYNSAACNDGNACTLADVCKAGACTAGQMLACDDSNPCTDDACDPKTGCTHSPNSGTCTDGNPCTAVDSCSQGVCSGTGQIGCDDGNPCTDDSCDPKKGCIHVANTAPCNDSDPCTTVDTCSQGVCLGAVQKSCDDGNPCTSDTCKPFEGCLHSPDDGKGCDDGNPCTTSDGCLAGACIGTGQASCDDGNICTDDACVAYVGCKSTPHDGLPCDDANACTLQDVCVGGKCLGSGAPVCNDGNACTQDACVPPGGCKYTPIVPCCGDGKVNPPEECDDGNVNPGDGCNAQCTKESAVTMTWTDNSTGSCSNSVYQSFKQIAAAMPTGPINVTITANQVQPQPNYGNWTATFENTTCIRLWLEVIGNRNTSQYTTWKPGVCSAVDKTGTSYNFVCKSDGANNPQIAIFPTSAQDGQYMKIYMLDRTFPWCDLAGVNSRPGYEAGLTNTDSSGVSGDSISFTWWK